MSDSENKKILLLIGNGFGRAFDNKGFAIESILKQVSSKVSNPTKIFFEKIFLNGFPQNEEELGLLEELNDAMSIVDKLPFRIFLCDRKLPKDRFADESFKQEFLDCFRELKTEFLKCIQNSCTKVINDKKNGYESFSKRLLQFIEKNRPTIATLNYDHFLYKILCKSYDELLKKNDGYTDGFYAEQAEGKSDSKKIPKFVNEFFKFVCGMPPKTAYLPLHGAYLYTQNSSKEIEKQSIDYIPSIEIQSLVILTSQKKKIQFVYDSPQDFFRTYSGYFFEKLLEANHIIIFGYGGGDEYLNTNLRYVIKKANANKKKKLKTTIICREGEISDEKLCEKWSKILTGEENSSGQVKIESENNKPLKQQDEGTCKIRKFVNLKEFEWKYEVSS